MKKFKPDYNWVLKVTVLSFAISILLGLLTNTVVNDLSISFSVFVLILVVLLGIVFDIIGLAVATATEVPFHAKSAKKVPGAKESIDLIRNAEKVSSFCNDVIGDIAGVLSGGLAASVAINIFAKLPLANSLIINLLMTAFVSAMTVGGKAYGKNFAISKSYIIVENCGKLIYRIKKIFMLKKKDT